MKWHIHESCGNSPKNKMLIDWVQDFIAKNESTPFIDEKSTILYKGETKPLSTFNLSRDILEMYIDKSITHGNDGAVLGKAVLEKQTHLFALFFEFSLGKQPKIKKVYCVMETINV